MIGCLRTRVRKQPIIVLYFEFENKLKFYNLGTIVEEQTKIKLELAVLLTFGAASLLFKRRKYCLKVLPYQLKLCHICINGYFQM